VSPTEAVEQGPRRWNELDRKQKRRETIETSLAVTATWIVLFGVYFAIPFDDREGSTALVRLVGGLLAFVVLLAWQLHSVRNDDLPEQRAIQALGVAIPLFLIAFAGFYLSLSQASTDNFSEPLNHTDSLYFVVTMFSTVGFGDITPKTGLARTVVSAQMLLDLVVIGAVVRLLLNAIKTGFDD
jgi:voltage-gated potassium channel